MKMFFENFEFLRPHFLWLLPVVLICLFTFPKLGFYKTSWEKVCDPLLLKYLLIKEKTKSSIIPFIVVFIGFLVAIIALAGPSFEKEKTPMLHFSNPVYFVLELTDEMEQKDIRPSRLIRAKIEIADILKKSGASPVGLIVYAEEPFVISPLTDDANLVANLLPEIRKDIMPVGGVRTDRAVRLAFDRLKSAGYAFGNILLLTSDNDKNMALIEKEVQYAAQNNIKTSVYGLSRQNEQMYQKIAKIGHGVFADAFQNNGQELVHFLKTTDQTKLEETQNQTEQRKDNGYLFVFIPALCMLYFFRKGFFVVVFFLLMTTSVKAGFLYSQDQEAFKLFNEKKYDKAASMFQKEDWKASSYYRAKDYQKAAEILKDKKDIESVYNRGNALAKSGALDEAIKAYEKVLEQNPGHEDAKFNLEYIKQMKQQQQKQQNRKENKKDQQKEQNKEQQSSQNNQDEKNDNNHSQSTESSDEEQSQNQEQQNHSQNSGENEDQQNKPQEQNNEGSNKEQNLKNNSSLEKQQQQQMQAKEEKADKYDENVQARVQKLRKIKDDPGGLLRAFIKQEYLKNRYGK